MFPLDILGGIFGILKGPLALIVSDSDFRRVRNFVADGKTSTLYSGNTRHSDIHSSDYSLRSSLRGDVRGERSVK